MTTARIRFADFAQVLKELGFVSRAAELNGPRTVFHHAATDTLVVLPRLRPADKVSAGDLLTARFLIPARGVATEARLAELLGDAVNPTHQ